MIGRLLVSIQILSSIQAFASEIYLNTTDREKCEVFCSMNSLKTNRNLPVPFDVQVFSSGYFKPDLKGKGDDPDFEVFVTVYFKCDPWKGLERFFEVECHIAEPNNNYTKIVDSHLIPYESGWATHIDLHQFFRPRVSSKPFYSLESEMDLYCRVRSLNAGKESSVWSQEAHRYVGPETFFSPPPIVSITFRDHNGTYLCATLDSNLKAATQLLHTKDKPKKLELTLEHPELHADVASNDIVRARFLPVALPHFHEDENLDEDVLNQTLAEKGRGEGTVFEASGGEIIYKDSNYLDMAFTDPKITLPLNMRMGARFAHNPLFFTHGFSSNWLDGTAFVAVPGLRNNSLVVHWGYYCAEVVETEPGYRVERTVYSPYGNTLVLLVEGNETRDHKVLIADLHNWNPQEGPARLKELFRWEDCRDCFEIRGKITGIALDVRGLLRSAGVWDQEFGDAGLLLVTKSGDIYRSDMNGCKCDLLLRVRQRDDLGHITTLAANPEHLYYAHDTGYLFRINWRTGESEDIKEIYYDRLGKNYAIMRIFDLELSSRSFKPYPANATCLITPSIIPEVTISHIGANHAEVDVHFPLNRDKKCSQLPELSMYAHVYVRRRVDATGIDISSISRDSRNNTREQNEYLTYGWSLPVNQPRWQKFLVQNLTSSSHYQIKLVLTSGISTSEVSDIISFKTAMSPGIFKLIMGTVIFFCALAAVGLLILLLFVAQRLRRHIMRERWLKSILKYVGGMKDSEGNFKTDLPVIPSTDLTILPGQKKGDTPPTQTSVDSGVGSGSPEKEAPPPNRVGEGAHGYVLVGLLKQKETSQQKRVALKYLSGKMDKGVDKEDYEAKQEFLFFTEADAMNRLQNPSSCPFLVHLFGVCIDTPEPAMVMELMECDVKQLLEGMRESGSSRCQLSEQDAIRIAMDVANGLKFLHEEAGYVHRDLRAANILLTSKNPLKWIAKIGDFGLAKDLTRLSATDNERRHAISVDDRIPVRHSAPETLPIRRNGQTGPIHSFKSDIWSFGVFCWEMATLGDTPYRFIRGLHDVQVYIHSGTGNCGNPGKPLRFPALYEFIMLPCWEFLEEARPSASQLIPALSAMLPSSPVIGKRAQPAAPVTLKGRTHSTVSGTSGPGSLYRNHSVADSAYTDTSTVNSSNLSSVRYYPGHIPNSFTTETLLPESPEDLLNNPLLQALERNKFAHTNGNAALKKLSSPRNGYIDGQINDSNNLMLQAYPMKELTPHENQRPKSLTPHMMTTPEAVKERFAMVEAEILSGLPNIQDELKDRYVDARIPLSSGEDFSDGSSSFKSEEDEGHGSEEDLNQSSSTLASDADTIIQQPGVFDKLGVSALSADRNESLDGSDDDESSPLGTPRPGLTTTFPDEHLAGLQLAGAELALQIQRLQSLQDNSQSEPLIDPLTPPTKPKPPPLSPIHKNWLRGGDSPSLFSKLASVASPLRKNSDLHTSAQSLEKAENSQQFGPESIITDSQKQPLVSSILPDDEYYDTDDSIMNDFQRAHLPYPEATVTNETADTSLNQAKKLLSGGDSSSSDSKSAFRDFCSKNGYV